MLYKACSFRFISMSGALLGAQFLFFNLVTDYVKYADMHRACVSTISIYNRNGDTQDKKKLYLGLHQNLDASYSSREVLALSLTRTLNWISSRVTRNQWCTRRL